MIDILEIFWSSLASNRVQACDGERVTLHCPRHTHIHVDTGFYGRVVPPSELCPSRRPPNGPSHSPASLKLLHPSHSLTCDVIHAKTKLSELCDKRRKCTIVVAAATFEEDPCPGIGKYLQMSYKCRPVSFESATFCEGEQMGMECREGKRLAIHSATWSRNSDGKCSPGDVMPAGAMNGHSCSRDVLMEMLKCHGQLMCSVPLTEKALGLTCVSPSPNQLHVSFVCVNEEIFSEETIRGELDYSLQKKYIEGSGDDEEVKPAIIEKPKPKPKITTKKRDKSSEELIRAKPILDRPIESEKTKEIEKITVEEHIEQSMRDHPPMTSRGSGPKFYEDPPSFPLSDAEMRPSTSLESPIAEENPNLVGVAHDVMLVAKFFGDHREETLWAIGIGVSVCVLCPLIVCLCLCRASRVEKKDGKLRYSIETSQLFAKGSQMLDGPSHLVDIGDLPEETFIRYSCPSSRSTHIHYDF